MKAAIKLYRTLKSLPTDRSITHTGLLATFPQLRKKAEVPCTHKNLYAPMALQVAEHLVIDDDINEAEFAKWYRGLEHIAA